MSRLRLCLALAFLPLAALPAHAQVSSSPTMINYQGRLATLSGNPVPDGTYSIRFSLWDVASGGTATNEKWNQTIANVQVKNGTFAVLLNTAAANLFNSNLWLEIKIGTEAALSPRQQIVSVPYALKANSVPDGAILTAALANNAVTSPKIADNSIGNADLLSDALSLNKVSGGALTLTSNRLFVPNGVIQKGGSAVTNTSDLGLYSMTSGSWLRLVSNNAPIQFFTNSTAGTTGSPSANSTAMTITASGFVGIGTTTPGGKLTVQDGLIVASNTSGGTRSLLGVNGTADSGYMQIWGPANKLLTGLGGDTNGGAIFVNNASGASTISANGTRGEFFALSAHIGNGIIQKGGSQLTGTTDLGLYSQASGSWMRFVTNGAPFQWYSDGGTGTTPILTLESNGDLRAKVVVITGGSDVAEPYTVAPAGEVKAIPGYVVAIDPDKVGQMRVASHAYDSTVAGIVSGAGGVNPGITLSQKGTVADGELPVASIGRVWCWCDADKGEIKAGDLLTSSDTPGHAMKAIDRERRDGAVIGKAMSSLKSGKGLVLVLVSLK